MLGSTHLVFSFFKNGPTPATFCLFSFFSNTNFTDKTVGFSGIWTQIVGVEGKHADRLTTAPNAAANSFQTFLHFLVFNVDSFSLLRRMSIAFAKNGSNQFPVSQNVASGMNQSYFSKYLT